MNKKFAYISAKQGIYQVGLQQPVMPAVSGLSFGYMLLLLILMFVQKPALSVEPIPDTKIPEELKQFIEPDTKSISLNAVDLNGDGLKDYILVIEKQHSNAPNIEDKQRSLLIVVRQPDNRLQVIKRSDKVMLCSTCGGVWGDPFDSIKAWPKTFTISHYGGSRERWATNYKFSYSRRDDTWQLVRAEEISSDILDPKHKQSRQVLKSGKHFGKIDISDFDPENYLSKGER